MSDLMYYAVEELFSRSGTTDNYDGFPIPRASIGQTSILLSATEILIRLSHHIHISTNRLQLIKNDIGILRSGVNVSLD
jgi:hypothetical protein